MLSDQVLKLILLQLDSSLIPPLGTCVSLGVGTGYTCGGERGKQGDQGCLSAAGLGVGVNGKLLQLHPIFIEGMEGGGRWVILNEIFPQI